MISLRFRKFLSVLTAGTAFVVGCSAMLISCSSNIKRVELSENADPNQEINMFEADLKVAQNQQADVLAPESYEKAANLLEKAKSQRQKNSRQKRILETIGEGKAYLIQANQRSNEINQLLFDVTKARTDALEANAKGVLESDLKMTDRDLIAYTKEFENGKLKISQEEREKLKNRYLDLELNAIKIGHLSQAKSFIEAAEKNHAAKYAPKTLAEAKARLAQAETVITTDRHNTDQIEKVSQEAIKAAKKLVDVTKISQEAKGHSSEDVALKLESKQEEAETLQEQNKAKGEEVQDANQQIKAVTEEKNQLEKKDEFNSMFEKAQQALDPNQAEVSRQGNRLVIRMKSLNFPSGRADLPADSFSILNQVKDILGSMNTGHVTVVGHTDAIGSKQLNQALSKQRADAIAKFLVSEKAVDSARIDTRGVADEKPLATNKTKQGRAQNRSVDLIIEPAMKESL